MSTIRIVKTIKQIHPKDVLIVKIGTFYHVYGKDAYIIAYLFGYKLRQIENNCWTCGFPLSSYNRIIAKLEEKKINYLTVDRRNNYEKDEEYDNNNLNNYEETYTKARRYVMFNYRAERIYNYLKSNIEAIDINEKMKRIEGIINEGR